MWAVRKLTPGVVNSSSSMTSAPWAIMPASSALSSMRAGAPGIAADHHHRRLAALARQVADGPAQPQGELRGQRPFAGLGADAVGAEKSVVIVCHGHSEYHNVRTTMP